jgi:hypothetical protein
VRLFENSTAKEQAMRRMKALATAMLASVALATSMAFAEQEQPVNAAPLGMELGVATYAQVKQAIEGASDAGSNAYSGGRMLRSDGRGLDVEGLRNVVFIFDKSDVLVGAVLP